MPKPIKKKLVKQETHQEDVQEIMSKLAHKAAQRKKQIIIAAIAAVMLILLGSAVYIYSKNATKRADMLEFEAYKNFNGLYETEPLLIASRLETALTKFTQANEIKSTPFREYYIAATLFEMGKYDEAITALEQFMGKYANNMRFIPSARFKIAMAYKRKGDMDKAIKTLNDFNFHSTNALKDLALIESAEILESLGRDEEAQQRYSLLVREHQNSRFVPLASSKLKQPEPSAIQPGDAMSISPAGAAKPPAGATESPEGQQQPPLNIELK